MTRPSPRRRTAREAFDEFLATIARDGIASFVEDNDISVH
ncbi:hypothetical protein J2X43_002654 [Rhizobium sp. BE258]|jgi:hypothetical protein|nr:hypothetical protein [Rhizobium sp. BE258]